MGLWQKLTGEFVDIIEWSESRSDVIVHRFDRHNDEIKNGAKLVVREGQVALVVNEGQLGKDQIADIFTPGTHALTTQNLPILSTIKGWKYGFESPFKAEVYFFNTRLYNDLKWGTPGPSTMRDPEFGVVRVTAFGLYAIRVKSPATVLLDLHGTRQELTIADIETNLRGKVGTRIKEVMPELGVAVIDLESKVTVLGEAIRARIAPDFEKLGFELAEVQVQDVGLPPEVEKAIDQQGAVRAVGNLQGFAQYQAAQALRDAAQNPGASGAMFGVGVAGGLGQTMGGLLQPAPAAPPPMPPPLPQQAPFFAAIDGAQAGPFDVAALTTLIAQGRVNRDTLVWRTGMAAWSKAGEQTELAGAFAQVPPPLPPG